MMKKGYAVKTMVYLGSDGKPVKHLRDAELFNSLDEAEEVAVKNTGWPVCVSRPCPKKRKTKRNKRSNQSWMKERFDGG